MKPLPLMIAIAWIAAGAASAQPAPPAPDVEVLHQAVLKACAADQEKFCHGKTGREGHDCMAAALPKAVPACQAAIAAMPQTPPPQQSAAKTSPPPAR